MQERINGFLRTLKTLKLWQMGALAVVLFGSAGATYGVYASSNGANGPRLEENQQLIPVQYGDLVNQISTNGSITFPQRDALAIDFAGKVAEVLVKEGQLVTQGQVLARFDPSTVVSLEESVADARVALRDAQNALSDLELDHALQVAEADEAVASAEFALQEAREALDEAQEPVSAQEIKAQEQAVAAARLDLKSAEEALLDLGPNYDQQLAEALKANREAETELEDARQALARFESDQVLQLASATQAKAAAEVALDDARKALESYKNARGTSTLEGLRLEKERAEASVAQLQSQIDRLIAEQQTVSGDLSGRIRSLEHLLEPSQEMLDGLQAQVAEVERLEAEVELAEQELARARDELAELGPGPDPMQRQQLEAAVQVALAEVAVTAREVTSLIPGVDPLELALRQSDLALAETALAQAEEDLAEMTAGPDPVEVSLQERQLAVAEAELAKARAAREVLPDEPDPLDLALRQAKVAAAQQALDDAVSRLEKSTLRSPINGLVSLVNVEEGEEVQASTSIVEVVDTSIVEIDGILDEIDVLSVQEGTPVRVTLDALSGQTFEGVVAEIAPAAQGQQGVVTFPVSIQVQVPPELRLREGLTAVASIVLSEEKDVLLVPQQALYGTFDQPVVRVLTGSGIEERQVSLGNTDDFWVAVHEGLQEGDQVVMESSALSTTGPGFGRVRSISGGTFRVWR